LRQGGKGLEPILAKKLICRVKRNELSLAATKENERSKATTTTGGGRKVNKEK